MKGGDIEYKGDPLRDFTLMRFLDRFVYKNPKRKERDHGGSLMQPKTSSSRLAEEPVNTKAFLLKKEEDIREDELFFHRYFKQKAKKENKRKKKTNDSVDETSEMASNFDNIQEERSSVEFNFASELKSSKERGASENKHTASDEEDEGDDEEQSEDETDSEGEDMAGKEQNSSEEEFDYEAMDFSSTDDEEGEEPVTSQGKKKKTDRKRLRKGFARKLEL